MLIEFKVANFRSIRDEQKLSLVASNTDADLPGSVIERDLPGLGDTRFLKGAAIYGANASGKSNVIRALQFLANFVGGSATEVRPGERIGTEPFKLDTFSRGRPSEFEITFLAKGVRYVFELCITTERVIEESLVAYPKGSPQRWYTRTYDPKTKAYHWARPSSGFKQDKSLQDKTRENSLFLSVGPQFNHPQLTPVFEWFESSLRFIQFPDDAFDLEFTAKRLKNDKLRARLLRLLQSADIGVVDVDVQELTRHRSSIVKDLSTDTDIFGGHVKRESYVSGYDVRLIHATNRAEAVPLDFEQEESAGTRQLFGMIGPWLDVLDKGYTFFIDEIETSLHPILVRELLKLLLSEKTNPKGAQVIFTTHNPLLLDKELLRRDQVWFTEKSRDGATHLYPLTDYKPRKDEARTAGYLAGRYGGVPFIPEGLQL